MVAVLPFLELSSNGISFKEGFVPGTARGIDLVHGRVAAGVGAVLVLTGAIVIIARAASRWFPATLAVLMGLVLAGATGLFVNDLEQRFSEFAVQEAASDAFPADEVRREMNQLFIQDAVEVNAGPGPWVTLAAASLAVATGVVGLRRRKGQIEDAEDPSRRVQPTEDQKLSQADDEAKGSSQATENEAGVDGSTAERQGPKPSGHGTLGDTWAG